MSVAISFENMVYEDALTILSYASPYPVKITLQKEQQIPRNRKLSDIRTNLNHPLYRSQSVDALQAIPGENELSISKRSTSAIRYDKRDSPQTKRPTKRNTFDENIMEEPRAPFNSNDDVFENSATTSRVDALVHRENVDLNGALHAERDVSHHKESNLHKPTDKKDAPDDDKFVAMNSQFSDVFNNLTEQDKLDVLRLSYDDPDAIPDSSLNSDRNEESIVQVEAGEQKKLPVKPERKKKRSSSNSTPSQSDVEGIGSPPLTPKEIQFEDVIMQELLPPSEAPPPIPTEAEEEVIQPETKTRNVIIESGQIEFEVVTPTKAGEGDDEKTLVDSFVLDASLNDTDVTLVSRSPIFNRADSPIDDLVDEEPISPTQIQKENSVPVSSTIFIKSSNDVIPDDFERDECNSIENDEEGKKENDIDFDKGIPSLDLNLNFDADSIIFKDSFPKRNTKETENGMAYDISVAELESMEEKAREDELSKLENMKRKGGIAFEVRDDYVNGETRTVNTNSVHRTASYDIRSTHDKLIEREISSQRPTSLKADTKQEGSGMFEWSGKRLVRSDSFTDIPQDDPVKDWTNRHNLADDDDSFENRIKEDSKSPVLSPNTHGDLNAKIKDDSDSDSQCRSLSSSTSGEDLNSMVILNTSTNGEDDGLGISPDTSPVKISSLTEIHADMISRAPEYQESDKKITVELNSTLDNDMDC